MTKALLLVIAAGAAIGLMMPTGRGGTPVASAAAPAAEETRVPRQRNGHFYVDATVNGAHVRFLVDTGASMVALTPEDAERVGIDVDPSRFEVIGRGASGPVRGQTASLDSVEIGGKRVANVPGAVIEGAEVSLLGQSYLSRIGEVSMSGDTMVLR